MMFRRRHPPSIAERIRIGLWPRRSWKRSASYMLQRMRRLAGSPHVIALGIAAGVFAACLPYWGIQFIAASMIAWMIGGSVGAAVLGTFIANPLTVPLIWVTSYQLGDAMLGGEGGMNAEQLQQGIGDNIALLSAGTPGATAAATDFLWNIIMPMSIGSLPLGLSLALVSYFLSRRMVESYHRTRFAVLHGQVGRF